jgi:HK97 family phage portal protein
LALQGPFKTPAGAERAADDIVKAMSQAYEEGRQALAIPIGHELKPLGFDPEKMQMMDLLRFLKEEVASVFALPPTFLQDLTNGTHSNTEQQDLHFAKHTLNRWTIQTEQELNLKLFGRNSNARWVKFNTDGLLRGDFKTRMEGHAQAVQNGFATPNEVRALEGRGAVTGGEEAYIQGATMPLKNQKDAKITKGGDGGSGDQ